MLLFMVSCDVDAFDGEEMMLSYLQQKFVLIPSLC